MERSIGPKFLKGMAILGLASLALSPFRDTKVWAAQDKTYVAEGLSSDPELTLELSCSDPHLRNEHLRWKPHIDIKTSYWAFLEEGSMLTIEDSEKTIQVFPLPARGPLGIEDEMQLVLESHGNIIGFKPGESDENGLPVVDEIWLESGKPVKVGIYESDGDYTKPLGRNLAWIEDIPNCPDAQSGPDVLEPV